MSTTLFKRPPRIPPPSVPTGTVSVEVPPEQPRAGQMSWGTAVLPMLAGVGSMAFLFAGPPSVTTYAVGGMFLLSTIGMGSMGITRGRGMRRQQLKDDRRDYMRYIGQLREAAREAARSQREAALWSHPAPASLWAVATGPRLWERRPVDDDFLSVRVGTSPQDLTTPLRPNETAPFDELEPVSALALRRFLRTHSLVPDLPVALALRRFSTVAISGRRASARSLLRAVLTELATFHSPDDLRICICASAAALPEWEWAKWLPHTAHPTQIDATGAARLITEDLGTIEASFGADLKDRNRFTPYAPPPAEEPYVVLVLDGGNTPVDSMLLGSDGLEGVTVFDLHETLDIDIERNGIRVVLDGARLGLDEPAGVNFFARSDSLSVAQAEAVARRLAPMRLSAVDDDEPLLVNLGLPELLGLGDPAAIEPAATWRPRPQRERLRIPIGIGETGDSVALDLKESAQGGMGPHGLVIGATGSGKSELLRTLVLGLDLTHSSETLNQVLVDFKGGATFAGMANLPHTAAVITNLEDDLSMVDRMRDALQGEMVRRQELLRAAGNYASVRDYERARETGAALDPLPSLLVIVDEFSELLSNKPDFIELFVAIGRLGRSLGIHLLLASQRLEEGKLRGLDSHLSYRIGLRTFSAMESRVVLGVPDAYELPSVPGSGYLKVDTSGLIRFKAAYVSGTHRTSAAEPRSSGNHRHPIAFTAAPVLAGDDAPATDAQPAAPVASAGLGDSVMDVVIRQLEGQGPPAHQVWLPPLAESPTLDELLPPLTVLPDRGLFPDGWPVASLRVPLGIVDKPYEQRRDPLWIDLSAAAGHAVIVGGPQSGKSTMLRSLISACALTHTPEEMQFYILDFGGGTLSGLADLPHVGAVAGRLEPELVRRLVAEVVTLLEERERNFRSLGVDSMPSYRAKRAAGELSDQRFGDVVIVIDGWLTFRQDYEQLEQLIVELATRGLGYGVHVVLTATRWAEVRPALRDQLGTRIELRLGDPTESDIDRRAAVNVPTGVPGRGLTREKLHLLAVLPRIDGTSSSADLSNGVADLVRQVADAWQGTPAPRVRLLPRELPAAELPRPGEDITPGVPIGIDEAELAPVYLDFTSDPHFIAFGDGESGKTGLLRLLAQGITARMTPEQARLIVVDYRRTLLDTVPEEHLIGYAPAAPALTTMVADIHSSLIKRLPGPDVTAEQLRRRTWWSGPELFVLVDDYDLVVTQSGNPLLPLAELLPQAKDIGLHLIVTRRSGGAGRAVFEPLLQRLIELGSPGILLSGSRDEGALLGGVKSQEQPPGRGQLVSRRAGSGLIQLGWLPPPA